MDFFSKKDITETTSIPKVENITKMLHGLFPAGMDVSTVLDELEKYGRPRLNKNDNDSWYCKIEINIKSAGTDFEVTSEFGHKTHLSAAKECLKRTIKALDDLTLRKNI